MLCAAISQLTLENKPSKQDHSVCWDPGLLYRLTSDSSPHFTVKKENQKDSSESLLSLDEPCCPDLDPGESYIEVRFCFKTISFVMRSVWPQQLKSNLQCFKFKEKILMD